MEGWLTRVFAFLNLICFGDSPRALACVPHHDHCLPNLFRSAAATPADGCEDSAPLRGAACSLAQTFRRPPPSSRYIVCCRSLLCDEGKLSHADDEPVQALASSTV